MAPPLRLLVVGTQPESRLAAADALRAESPAGSSVAEAAGTAEALRLIELALGRRTPYDSVIFLPGPGFDPDAAMARLREVFGRECPPLAVGVEAAAPPPA